MHQSICVLTEIEEKKSCLLSAFRLITQVTVINYLLKDTNHLIYVRLLHGLLHLILAFFSYTVTVYLHFVNE